MAGKPRGRTPAHEKWYDPNPSLSLKGVHLQAQGQSLLDKNQAEETNEGRADGANAATSLAIDVAVADVRSTAA